MFPLFSYSTKSICWKPSDVLIRGRNRHPEAIFISAARGHRLWELKEKIALNRTSNWQGSESILTPEGAGEGVAAIFRLGEMLNQTQHEDGRVTVQYRVPIRYQRNLEEILSPLLWKPEPGSAETPRRRASPRIVSRINRDRVTNESSNVSIRSTMTRKLDRI